ncbi:hypothetical protein [Rhizobium sp. Root1203]
MAWVLAQGTDIVPVIGARRPGHLIDVLASWNLNLTPMISPPWRLPY